MLSTHTNLIDAMIIINNSESVTQKLVVCLCENMTDEYKCFHIIQAQSVQKFSIPKDVALISISTLGKIEKPTLYKIPVNTRIMCTDTAHFSLHWLNSKYAINAANALPLVPNQ